MKIIFRLHNLFFLLCMAFLLLSISQEANAAGSESQNAVPAPEAAGTVQQPTGEEAKGAAEDGSGEASGTEETKSQAEASQKVLPEQAVYPGVQNILYRSGDDNEPHAIIWYPSFGNEMVDSDIKYFVATQGADFSKDVEDSVPVGEEKPASYDQWEMTGFYTLTRPAPDIVSITFNIYSYSGGAHGNLFIRCLNYDLETGKSIELEQLFSSQEKALDLMSAYCESKLREDLGNEVDEDMLRSGTMAEANNFLNLSLEKDGLTVEFQPYQVGPWSIGPQSVQIPLSELSSAGPNPRIWPAGESAPKNEEQQ